MLTEVTFYVHITEPWNIYISFIDENIATLGLITMIIMIFKILLNYIIYSGTDENWNDEITFGNLFLCAFTLWWREYENFKFIKIFANIFSVFFVLILFMFLVYFFVV